MYRYYKPEMIEVGTAFSLKNKTIYAVLSQVLQAVGKKVGYELPIMKLEN
jgi:hypothetical protein